MQAPGFLTSALHLVFQRLGRGLSRGWSLLGLAVPAAWKRKFERMGMVVLRSTTDWAAVSSRRSSRAGDGDVKVSGGCCGLLGILGSGGGGRHVFVSPS